MAQDTLLGFPAHTLPYRRGEFSTLSTDSIYDVGFVSRSYLCRISTISEGASFFLIGRSRV